MWVAFAVLDENKNGSINTTYKSRLSKNFAMLKIVKFLCKSQVNVLIFIN